MGDNDNIFAKKTLVIIVKYLILEENDLSETLGNNNDMTMTSYSNGVIKRYYNDNDVKLEDKKS